MSSERLPAIDALRGVAFLAVLYHHVFGVFTPPGFRSVDWYGHLLLPFAPLSNGWLGVNLFFILSGFVLFAPYEAGSRTMVTKRHVLAFYRRRAKRLLPLYYFVSLLCFSFLVPASAKQWSSLFMLVTVSFNFTKDFFPVSNWVLWSLGIEIWMSIAFPLLVLGARRFGIWKLAVFVELLALVTRIAGNHPQFYLPLSPVLNFVKDSVIGRLDDFVVGMAMAYLYRRLRSRGRPLPATQIALSLGLGLLAIYATAVGWDAVRLQRLDRAFIPFTNVLFQLGCVLSVTALLLLRGPIARAIANPVLQILGMMCYSLYVWHGVVKLSVLGIDGLFTAAQLGMFLVILVAISALSYRYIEFGHVRDARSLFRPAVAEF